MGKFINRSSCDFERSLSDAIYVDKSLLIGELNGYLGKRDCYVCMSRPRRFGKSMALEMLAAYYQSGEDTHSLFGGLKIARHATFERHINKYDVVWIDMQEVLTQNGNVGDMLEYLRVKLLSELRELYGISEERYLFDGFSEAFEASGRAFVFLIDEWDCVLRAKKGEREQQRQYLDFIRGLFKGQSYVGMAYMTGILPIRNYGDFSTLNIFDEFTVVDPGSLAEYFGFTEGETRALCERFGMDYSEVSAWYDGYELDMGRGKTTHVYNPNSVVRAMLRGKIASYWRRTEQMEALAEYINMDFKGLRGDVARLIAGEHIEVEVGGFKNDLETFGAKDDILTLLIHLGYLTYDAARRQAYIPNREVAEEFYFCVRDSANYSMVYGAIEASRDVLRAIWRGDTTAVCAGIKKAHEEMPIIRRNDENSLACVISIALYSARDYYTVVRKMPAGEGFADMAFIPHPDAQDKPAMIVELKWDKSARTAIDQIRSRNYPAALEAYEEGLLLVGINYEKDSGEYECVIERAAR